MTGTELFANQAQTVISSGGTTAPSSGTSETWTAASPGAFPVANPTASPATFFRLTDPAASAEKIIVTDSRTSPWTVTRGAEGTTPVAHAAGFTVQNVMTAATLAGFYQGTVTALLPVAVQTASYTPGNGQFAPFDVTAGSVTSALPATPANNTLVGFGLSATASGHTLTVTSGSASINGNGAVTSMVLSLPQQAVVLCYSTASATWWVIGGNLPLAGASGSAVLITGSAMQGYLAPAVAALTYGSTVAVNAALGNSFNLTLTGATCTVSNPTNPADGQVIRFRVTQDATGGRGIAWDTAYDFGAGTAPTPSAGASKTDIFAFEYVASISKWCFLGSGLGF